MCNTVKGSSLGDDNKCIFERLILENILLTALALANSALVREDSVGCHWRLDFEKLPEKIYRTDVYMKNNKLYSEKIY